MAFGRKKDGRIRVRCSECGKALKLPADEPGRVFRCPICANTVIAPIEAAHEDESPEAAAPVEGPPEAADAPSPDAAAQQPPRIPLRGWDPVVDAQPKNKAISRLIRFLNRENDRLREVAIPALHNPDVGPGQRERRMMSLRQDRNVRLRKEIDSIIAELDEQIIELVRSPNAARASVRESLKERNAEKSALYLFLRAIFGLRLDPTRPEEDADILGRDQ